MTSIDKLGIIVAISVVVIFVAIGVGMSNVSPDSLTTSRPGVMQEGFDPRMTPNIPVRETPPPVTREIETINEKNIIQNEKKSDCVPQRTLFQKLVNQNPEFLKKYGDIISSNNLESSHIFEVDSEPITISYDEHNSEEKPFGFTETLRLNINELKKNGQFNNPYFIEDKFLQTENGVIIYKRTLFEISNEFQYGQIFERSIPIIDISNIETSPKIAEKIQKQSELCPNDSADISSVTGIYEDIEYVVIENNDSCYDLLNESEKILYPLFGCIVHPHSSVYQDAKDYAKGIMVENMPSVENCEKDGGGTYTCGLDFIHGFTKTYDYHEGVTEKYVQDLLVTDVEVYYLDFSIDLKDTVGLRTPIFNEIVVENILEIIDNGYGVVDIISTIEGKDLDADDYKKLGIETSQLNNGHEFIFIFDNKASAHARALGINLIGPYSIELGNVNEGIDFETPLAEDLEFSINIPQLIQYDTGILSLGVDAKADIAAKSNKITAEITSNGFDELEFSPVNSWKDTVSLEKDNNSSLDFNFSDLRYYPEIIIDPQARISITTDLDVVDFTYKTGYAPIFSITITPELKTHDGSNGTFEFNFEK